MGDATENRDALLRPFRSSDTVDPQDDISLAAREREPRVGLSCRNHGPQYRSVTAQGSEISAKGTRRQEGSRAELRALGPPSLEIGVVGNSVTLNFSSPTRNSE